MPRLKLEEQPRYEFCHALTVRLTDTNLGGHLATEAMVGLLQEARAQALRQLGFSSLRLGKANVGLAVADLAVSFQKEGALFDRLAIESHIGEIGQRSLRFYYRITRDGELLALAETGVVCFDYSVRKPVPVPESFLLALEEHRA
jgi:YbgC/YbaW family acyl-CoA thioester hydrolase